MDLAAFSRKYTGDIRGTQVGSGQGTDVAGISSASSPPASSTSSGSGAGWSDAGVIIPWTSWIQTGDTRSSTQNWDAMTKYLAAIEAHNPDFLWKKNAGIPSATGSRPKAQPDTARGNRLLGLRRNPHAADGSRTRQDR
jgi:alpha-L-rhamnosidase